MACSERVLPDEEDVMQHFDDRLLPSFAPQGPTGPVIDPAQAVTMVYRYVARYGPGYKPFFTLRSYAMDPMISLDKPVRIFMWSDPSLTMNINMARFPCTSVFSINVLSG